MTGMMNKTKNINVGQTRIERLRRVLAGHAPVLVHLHTNEITFEGISTF